MRLMGLGKSCVPGRGCAATRLLDYARGLCQRLAKRASVPDGFPQDNGDDFGAGGGPLPAIPGGG